MNNFKLITILISSMLFFSCEAVDLFISEDGIREGSQTVNPNCPYNNSSSSNDGSNSSDDEPIEEPDGTTTYNEGLVAHYSMTRGGVDETEFGNHGELEGSITNLYGVIQLDGKRSRLIAPHQEQLNLQNSFTLSAMINPRSIKTQSLLRKGREVNGVDRAPYSLGLSGTNEITFSISNENGVDFYQARGQGYPINQWFQLTGVFQDQQMKLYMNGLLVAEMEIEGTVNTNSNPLLIGTRLFGLEAGNVDGSIDEVRLYNRALGENDVKQLYLNLRKG